MGAPATPTPADRAATRELAAKIVESVRNDEAMPFRSCCPTCDRSRVFQLAHEIVLLTSDTYVSLQAEVERLGSLVDMLEHRDAERERGP